MEGVGPNLRTQMRADLQSAPLIYYPPINCLSIITIILYLPACYIKVQQLCIVVVI